MVRATFAGFSTALSAIQANQKRLDVVGQNLANMNTVGYTRQTLETSSINYRTPVSNYMNGAEVIVGFGVSMDRVSQIRDPYLDVQYRSQMQKAGYTEGLQASLDRLAQVFDESDVEGIHQAFVNIRSTLLAMHDAPKVNLPIYETELRTRMQALTNLLNDSSRQIDEAERLEFIKLKGEGSSEQGAVENVNNILMQIGNLNRQIKQNQILGQQSLELMDERNVLLDELASYIPIEVTYYKDEMHDGINADPDAAKAELYHLDSNGNPLFKKEWPDDLRVEMVYLDQDGNQQRLTLVEGTEGTGSQNYGRLEMTGDSTDPTNFEFTFIGSEKNLADPKAQETLTLTKDDMLNTADKKINQLTSGSIQASLNMLWKDGTTAGISDVNGYEYYRNQIDLLAKSFADVMNTINIYGANQAVNPVDPDKQFLLFNKDDKGKDNITAANIGINTEWVNGNVQISTAGESSTDTVLNMLEAMKATWPYSSGTSNLPNILGANNPDLKNNSFADYINHVSTVLANDSYNNAAALKTNVTVLNAIQDSRDSVSGVSMNEEASNMMMFQSAYNAASRLMTALDEVLNTLISNTGICGR